MTRDARVASVLRQTTVGQKSGQGFSLFLSFSLFLREFASAALQPNCLIMFALPLLQLPLRRSFSLLSFSLSLSDSLACPPDSLQESRGPEGAPTAAADAAKEACADSRAHLKHSIGVGVKRHDLLPGFLRQKRFLLRLSRLHSWQLLMPSWVSDARRSMSVSRRSPVISRRHPFDATKRATARQTCSHQRRQEGKQRKQRNERRDRQREREKIDFFVSHRVVWLGFPSSLHSLSPFRSLILLVR